MATETFELDSLGRAEGCVRGSRGSCAAVLKLYCNSGSGHYDEEPEAVDCKHSDRYVSRGIVTEQENVRLVSNKGES